MTADQRLKSPEALNWCPAKKFISSLRVPRSMPGSKPLKETQFCQLADEFPIARVPRDVYNLVELKHPQMHDCFRTSCHLYWNHFIFGKWIIVNGPVICAQPNFFQGMIWTHSMRKPPIINTCVIGDRQQKWMTIITSQSVQECLLSEDFSRI